MGSHRVVRVISTSRPLTLKRKLLSFLISYFRSANLTCLRKGGDICYPVAGDSRFHAIIGSGPTYIVHPSDLAPALIALGARIKNAALSGKKTIPLKKFFVLPAVNHRQENILQPGEILTEVQIPHPKAGRKGLHYKARERQAWDHAVVSVSTVVQAKTGLYQEARVVLGGVAPMPWRMAEAEEFLRGKKVDEGTARQARELALEGARPMKDNIYKVELAKSLIQRGLLASV